jgi:hypothetical protein
LDDGALFVTLAPNMVGCFAAGLLGTPAGVNVPVERRDPATHLACLPATHRLQRCAPACLFV